MDAYEYHLLFEYLRIYKIHVSTITILKSDSFAACNNAYNLYHPRSINSDS